MTKEETLNSVENAIDKAFDEGKELAIHDVRNMLQWCYNYVNKQEYSDEKKGLIEELKKLGCL